MAHDPVEIVDWTEYYKVTRSLCREVRTKEEYGALAAAQLVLLVSAQSAVLSSQLQLVDFQFFVHQTRLTADAQGEKNALEAIAVIEVAQTTLQTEAERLMSWSETMALDARINLRSVTPRDFPRRVLRTWCNDSFRETQRRVQHSLDVLLAQNFEISNISFDQFRPPID